MALPFNHSVTRSLIKRSLTCLHPRIHQRLFLRYFPSSHEIMHPCIAGKPSGGKPVTNHCHVVEWFSPGLFLRCPIPGKMQKGEEKNLQANNSLRQEAHVLSAFCQHHQAPKCATPGFHNTSPGSHNPKTAEILKYHDASKSNEHHLQ